MHLPYHAPCSNCRRTDTPPLKYVYLQYFKGEEMLRTRATLCPPCYDGLLGDYLAVCQRPGKRGEWLTQEEQAS